MRVAFDEMRDAVAAAFVAAGMEARKAEMCARVHAESSRDGVYSHGLNRVPRFVDYLRKGWVAADAEPEVVRQMGAIEVWDGARGPGVLNALAATDRALEMAGAQGMAVLALRNTTHWMRGGAYGWRAAERGKILIAWTNTESCMPAWGGRDSRLGNNPLVIAVPRGAGPVVLDMAMSQYSFGKLQTVRLAGEELPWPGGFDAAGEMVTDPGAIEATRRILPAGLWKGSGLAFVLDALAGILSEGLATHGIDEVDRGSCTGCSQIFMAFDPEVLGSSAHMIETVEGMVAHLHAAEPDERGRAVTYPGEGTLRMREENGRLGIPVDAGIWQEVLTLG